MWSRSPADPSSALQRSRSTFQLKESGEADGPEDAPWRQDMQVLLGSLQDTSVNRKESSGSECSNRSEFTRAKCFTGSDSDHRSEDVQEVKAFRRPACSWKVLRGLQLVADPNRS